jgi:hypothetical protein
MRGGTNLLEGEFEPWDPGCPEAFTRLAGERFLRADGLNAVVLNDDGSEETVRPGWLVFRADGGRVVFTTPGNVSEGTGTLFRVARDG